MTVEAAAAKEFLLIFFSFTSQLKAQLLHDGSKRTAERSEQSSEQTGANQQDRGWEMVDGKRGVNLIDSEQ